MELKELYIKNLGIIEDLVWQPSSGLNIITGETGAGKSLIIEALDLLFFSKADESSIRHGSNQAIIEAYFSLDHPTPAAIYTLFKERAIEYDHNELLVEAQIRRQGRSIYRINSIVVPKSVLGEIGKAIIDMHTQSQHLALFDPANHLDILDAFGDIKDTKTQFGAKLATLNKLQSTKKTLEKEAGDTERRRDFLAYEIDELTHAGLQAGEDEALEVELHKLASAEKIRELGHRLHLILTGGVDTDSLSAIDCCGQGLMIALQLSQLDNRFSSVVEEITRINTSLEDLGHDIGRFIDEIDNSDARLEEVENRLEALKTLKKKYRKDIDGLITYSELARQELEKLENIPINLEKLEAEISETKIELAKLAITMHDSRISAARKLESYVNSELSDLGMNGMKFSVLFEKEQDDINGLPISQDRKLAYSKIGIDRIVFTASTNPGEPLKPLHDVASTGEASRFTLAVKNALAQTDSTPILIFDEIDIGVGGRCGEVIGKKLWSLARHHQVICITHLPQIAAFADSHYRVIKVAENERHTTQIATLHSHDSATELAEMLSSKNYSDEAMQAAIDLVRKASEWKNREAK